MFLCPEYRDSGVEWLGEVPTAWIVTRIRSLRLDVLKPIGDLESGYTYFRNGDVTIAKITH